MSRWNFLKWPVVLGSLAAFLGLAYLVHHLVWAERKEEGGDAVKAPNRREPPNRVKLGEKTARAWGVEDEPARSASWTAKTLVFGRVVPNPRATFEARAPFAGILRELPKNPWPSMGNPVLADQVLGVLDIRLGPQERLDLALKLKEAQAKEKGAEDIFYVQKERLKRLESASPSVSQTDLDQARVQMVQARTELASARSAAIIWKQALDEINHPDRKGDIWSHKLRLDELAKSELEITELFARPGMAVEPGAPILRAVDFKKPLVRLDVPIVSLSAAPKEIGIIQTSVPSGGLEGGPQARPSSGVGKLTGRASQVDSASQLAGIWYEIVLTSKGGNLSPPWRPGIFVKAFLPDLKAKPRSAVKVRDTALLYYQGRALVYVRIGPGRYERRDVQVLGRDGDFWVLGGGVLANEPVVTRQAQILLSEEFRSQADND